MNKKLISARIDPDTINKIDSYTGIYRHWKRNTIISSVLNAVFDNFDPRDIQQMIHYSRLSHKDAKGTFSLNIKNSR